MHITSLGFLAINIQLHMEKGNVLTKVENVLTNDK